jgi:hypothetical protein
VDCPHDYSVVTGANFLEFSVDKECESDACKCISLAISRYTTADYLEALCAFIAAHKDDRNQDCKCVEADSEGFNTGAVRAARCTVKLALAPSKVLWAFLMSKDIPT